MECGLKEFFGHDSCEGCSDGVFGAPGIGGIDHAEDDLGEDLFRQVIPSVPEGHSDQ